MAIKRNVKPLGPGSLVFGDIGSQLDISCQVTAAKVTWESDKEDDLPTLCGGNIVGEKIYNAKLEFSAGQDTEADGMTDWSWTNKGKQVPVKFIPNEGEGAEITGTIVVDPTDFGGEVKKRNVSDAEWDFVGDPIFTPDNTADTSEYVEPITKTITLPVGTTGGNWTFTADGQTTATIAHNANAATVKAAFELLSNLTLVSVVAGTLSWTVTFFDFVNTLSADGSALTPPGTIVIS